LLSTPLEGGGQEVGAGGPGEEKGEEEEEEKREKKEVRVVWPAT
jgi:hypothetical protein